MSQKLSIWIGRLLLYMGWADPPCICGHKHSEHDFDNVTPTGFCGNGHYSDGCSCMAYEVKGSRGIEDRRGNPEDWKPLNRV
jgi:hypothetical protein